VTSIEAEVEQIEMERETPVYPSHQPERPSTWALKSACFSGRPIKAIDYEVLVSQIGWPLLSGNVFFYMVG
jgi:hypothetical protein